ncbi:TonB-dependent receptor [Pseudomonas sp. 21LCFQ010]|uniref:TonB-dependent siderophore receptor n=1 Tax=Pseudomonas sp. 21LCFQ010 TaxID=2957506 RepID=UPI0020972F84|nr:TonB-dependent receptor [Pseudomonas sp. 21LCFQ010]MCO8165750.1 TonB-dependent receptor [Pseudomonas sp. 21LCFQ010]
MPTHTLIKLTPLAKAFMMRTAFRFVLPLTGLGLVTSIAMASQAQEISLNIPPQPLASALQMLGSQTNIQVLYSSEQLSGLYFEGINGRYTIPNAVAELLKGTGLAYHLDGNLLSIKSPSVATSAIELGATNINSNTGTSADRQSYASRIVTIGKTEQSQKDIPQSVTVVTRQRMEDQNTDTFDQVIMKTPGISRQFVNSGQSNYYSRGFEMTKVLRDGVYNASTFGVLIAQAPDMATIERVEVLRGAPGLLLGAGEPSGVVNLVRKRPQKETELEITAKAGSWDYYRTELDLTGSLNKDGTIRGRTVVAYEDRDYFYDRAHTEMPLFYGVLESDITDQTSIMAGYRHQNYDMSGMYFYQGLPTATNGSDLKLSRSTSVGPDWSAYKSVADEVFSELSHTFNEDWKAKIATNFQRGEVYERSARRSSFGIDPAAGTARLRSFIDANYDLYQSGVDLSADGKFPLFGLEQKIVIGTNFQKEERDYKARNVDASAYTVNLLTDPEMSAVPKPDFSTGTLATNELHNETYGVYGSLILNPVDPLKIILGSRLTWYKTENYANGTQTNEFRQNKEFTPYLGLVYSLTPEWSAYASYTDIFQVQSSLVTSSGSPLDPSVGKNYEIGVKGELFNGRLNTSIALFRMVQDNRSSIDPAYPNGGCPASVDGYCYINAGKVKSEGFELEANGELLPGWQAFAGYTYNEAKYVKDRDAFGNATTKEGGQLGDVTPKHIFRAFTTYELPGALNRITIGGGVSAQSDLKGTNYIGLNSHMPGRAVWDVFTKYRIDDNWTIAANLNNVFDKVYYNDEYGYRYGEPRNVMFTLRGNFKDF